MAVYKIFPEKDTTIYSEYPNTNTGLDSILEIQNTSAILNSQAQVSRALIQFPSSKMLEVATLAGGLGLYSASLKLFIADTFNLPDNYTLYCHAVSSSWQAGTGRFLYEPPYTQGCTWVNKNSNDEWATSSFFTEVTASFLPSQPGGGVWWMQYLGSQSFNINETKDVDVNITNIIETFNAPGYIDNNGLILKMESEYEFNNSSSYSLKYFSKDTHTIYPPQLEIKWDDSIYNTGSLVVLNNQNIAVTLSNNIGMYSSDDICQLRINARPIFPVRQFVTQSVYTLNQALPSSSYWALQDLDTGEFVINFSTEHTKISCDPSGNYFTLYTAGLQPERYYKVLIQSAFLDGSIITYDNNYTFKITK